MQKEEYGNMTALVKVETGDQSHSVSWPPKVEGFEPLETSLDSFYVHCMGMARSMIDNE